ncbi:MAG: Gfo/Idh/MocA family oxidoreductase [Magnetococcales bacterium]|nr:Gfo/Idh/MocA family oxidoreductase [Magnetococcales bacterium]
MKGVTHPTSEQKLRAAVIGTGYLGRFHAQKYRAMAGVELVAVADLDQERGRQVGEELRVPWVADFRDLLDRVDLVSIAVPTQVHFAVAEACLKAGVHTLIEKPMTATLAEADELIRLAGQNKCLIQVGHLKRFHPSVVALEQSGWLKNCRFIESQRLAPFKNRGLDVDVVLDLMIHDVDLILHFVKSEVTGMAALGRSLVTRHLDVAHARLHFANGAEAVVSVSRVARESVRAMRFVQDDAFVSLDFISRHVHIVRRREASDRLDGRSDATVTPEVLPVQDYDTLEAQIRAFCDAVRAGCPPWVSGDDGRRALEVVMAVRQVILDANAGGGR